jgi:hypothetical protein
MATDKTPRTKEALIVFQNQSHLVQQHFSNCGYCAKLFEVALATDLMVEFAMYGYSSELKKRFDNLEAHMASEHKSLKEQIK